LTFESPWDTILGVSLFFGEGSMKFTVTYDEGVWIFEVNSTDGETSHNEVFEITDVEEAEEAAMELIREIREVEDPLAELFDDED
jgi:hypothetical protein